MPTFQPGVQPGHDQRVRGARRKTLNKVIDPEPKIIVRMIDVNSSTIQPAPKASNCAEAVARELVCSKSGQPQLTSIKPKAQPERMDVSTHQDVMLQPVLVITCKGHHPRRQSQLFVFWQAAGAINKQIQNRGLSAVTRACRTLRNLDPHQLTQ